VSDEARGFLLQPGYRVRDGVPVIQLYGALEGGGGFLVEDDRFRPYFFVREADAGLLARDRRARIEPTALRALDGTPLVRVATATPGDVPELRMRVEAAGGVPFESDLRFPYRYLIDRGLRAAMAIRGPAERLSEHLVRFHNPELAPAELHPKLRLLSIDIETALDQSRIWSIALVGCGADEVHLVAARDIAGAIGHRDEAALLRAVLARIQALDPDVITGWNVVDFDLRVLDQRYRARGIPFELGRAAERVLFQRDETFTRQSRVQVPGRQVLDGTGLVRDAAILLDDYRLDTAARVLLGRGKRIDEDAPDRGREIERMYREDPAAFVAYNREDARLVLEIVEREALLELAVERSLAAGMQLDRVGASIASFDLVYLPELRRRGFVAPSVNRERASAPVMGGAVLPSTPGLFRNVGVFDFKSLYPSLMRTFNLDPLAHARAGDDPIVAPNGAAMSRERGILPDVIERIAARREQAKQRRDRHADFALKILMNSLFGVLASTSCRFFDPVMANAITSFGQQQLGWTREAFDAAGARVLYGDTDSVFVALDPAASAEAARAEALGLRERVQAALEARVRAQYRVEPRFELELERIYARFFQPRIRSGARGSTKRYAGVADGRLEVVGLEAVRRDWPAAAKSFQLGLLEHLFTDQPLLPFVRERVARLMAGELDRELVIRKGLRKGSVERYTAQTPPHVEAARKAGGFPGREVRYVVTRTGAEPVLPGRPFPADLDRVHYLEKVFRPLAENILACTGESFDEALGRPRQLTLW
jgi:DNA polymerase II